MQLPLNADTWVNLIVEEECGKMRL